MMGRPMMHRDRQGIRTDGQSAAARANVLGLG